MHCWFRSFQEGFRVVYSDLFSQASSDCLDPIWQNFGHYENKLHKEKNMSKCLFLSACFWLVGLLH